MAKTIQSAEYRLLLDLLRQIREDAQIRQVDLAAALGVHQSYVSKVEAGERRLDALELRSMCLALGTTLPAFVERLEELLPQQERKAGRESVRWP